MKIDQLDARVYLGKTFVTNDVILPLLSRGKSNGKRLTSIRPLTEQKIIQPVEIRI
jgi:hypothetical protein